MSLPPAFALHVCSTSACGASAQTGLRLQATQQKDCLCSDWASLTSYTAEASPGFLRERAVVTNSTPSNPFFGLKTVIHLTYECTDPHEELYSPASRVQENAPVRLFLHANEEEEMKGKKHDVGKADPHRDLPAYRGQDKWRERLKGESLNAL